MSRSVRSVRSVRSARTARSARSQASQDTHPSADGDEDGAAARGMGTGRTPLPPEILMDDVQLMEVR